jgi:hypothetical protein
MLLYETLTQPAVFFIILVIGIACGIIFDLRSYIVFLCANNKVVTIILDILSVLLSSIIFYLCVLGLNFGEFRFYIVLSFLLGILLERFTLGLFVAKISSWCYNKFKMLISKVFHGRKNEKKDLKDF